MANLYAAARADYGLPADMTIGPGQILRQAGATDPNNRKYMIFFQQLAQRVIDGVMQNAAYEPITSAWPNCLCANYGDSRMDGELGPTGWLTDRAGGNAAINQYPHVWIDPTLGGPMYHEGPLGRWLATRQWASAPLDAMYLYKLNTCQWAGFDEPPCDQFPLRQPNLYLPGFPTETIWETSMRLFRFALESAINSYGGLQDFRLAPWLEMAFTVTEQSPIPGGWVHLLDRIEYCTLLARVRATNASDKVQLWTNWRSDLSGDDVVGARKAWLDTARCVRAVYAPRILGYTHYAGTIINGTADGDTSRLEFTLLNTNGYPRTVDMLSDTVSGTNATDLQVVFRGMDCFPTVGPLPLVGCQAPPTGSCSIEECITYYDYLLIDEDQTNSPSTVGQVFAKDLASGHWVHVPVTYPVGEMSYDFFTPDLTSRRMFALLSDGTRRFVTQEGYDQPPYGHMYLRVVHTNDSEVFVSKFDLIQVIPVPRGSIGTCCLGGPILKSDVDYDGVVTNADLVRYIEDWLSGKAAADINLDGQIDAEDLAEYLAAFGNGS